MLQYFANVTRTSLGASESSESLLVVVCNEKAKKLCEASFKLRFKYSLHVHVSVISNIQVISSWKQTIPLTQNFHIRL